MTTSLKTASKRRWDSKPGVKRSQLTHLRGVRDEEVELRGAHVHPGLRAVAARWFARASASAGQSSGALSSRDSVEGVQVLSVGVRQRVKVLLGCLDLVVTHPVHY
jgi:hypothetical protein